MNSFDAVKMNDLADRLHDVVDSFVADGMRPPDVIAILNAVGGRYSREFDEAFPLWSGPVASPGVIYGFRIRPKGPAGEKLPYKAREDGRREKMAFVLPVMGGPIPSDPNEMYTVACAEAKARLGEIVGEGAR